RTISQRACSCVIDAYRIQIGIRHDMTNHEFLFFLNAAYEYYEAWPHPRVLAVDLRANTPDDQAPWDRQARPIMARMLRKGLIAKVPCRAAHKGNANGLQKCGQMHIAMTELGFAQLKAWNELGCEAHSHSGHCHASESDLEFTREA